MIRATTPSLSANAPPRLLALAALLTLVGTLYFWGLGDIPFYSKGEPREGVQVWEEVHGGGWILPRRNGTELPSKPPLFHWLAGLVAVLTGAVDERSLRLPSALGAATTVLLVFWFGARCGGTFAGAAAAGALATSFEWVRAARVARVDMVLAACSTGALIAFGVAAAAPSPPTLALVLFYLCLGLAVLAKGPVGIVLPVLVALLYLAARRDLPRLRRMHPVPGIALAVAIPGLWYGLAIHHGGEAFIDKQVLGENLFRFLGMRHGGGHLHPAYYYVPAFCAGFLPWSLLLAPLVVHLYRRRRTLEADGLLYPLVWFAVIIAFYSLAGAKRAPYILSAYPAAALLLGAWWHGPYTRNAAGSSLAAAIVQAAGATVALAMLAVVVALATEGGGADLLDRVGSLLHPRDQANLPMIRESAQTHLGWFICASTVLILLMVLVAVSARRRFWRLCFVALAASATCDGVIAEHVGHRAIAAERTFRPFLEFVRQHVHDEDHLVFYRSFDYGAVFYSGRRIPVVRNLAAIPTATRTSYLLLWEAEWGRLDSNVRSRLEWVGRSAGTGPKGTSRLLLARVRPPLYPSPVCPDPGPKAAGVPPA